MGCAPCRLAWPGLPSPSSLCGPHPHPYAALTHPCSYTSPQVDQEACPCLACPHPHPSPHPHPYTPLQDDQGDRWPQLPRPRSAVWRRAVHQRSGHLGGGLRAGRAAATQGGWVVFSFCCAGMRTRTAVMDSMPSDKGPVLFPPPPPLMSLPLRWRPPFLLTPPPAAASPSGVVVGQQRHEPARAHVPRTRGAHGRIVAWREEPSQLHFLEVD